MAINSARARTVSVNRGRSAAPTEEQSFEPARYWLNLGVEGADGQFATIAGIPSNARSMRRSTGTSAQGVARNEILSAIEDAVDESQPGDVFYLDLTVQVRVVGDGEAEMAEDNPFLESVRALGFRRRK